MVDFAKKLGKKAEKKSTDPVEIYDSLDRASDKGPLRPAQIAILSEWQRDRRNEKNVILKLHTGQGKTLIGLLILQAKLNEGTGPALYLCPNKFLITQTCEQAAQFGVPFTTIDGELPDSFVNSKAILIASVQSLFNGLTKFGLGAQSQEVGSLIMDDAHACIDAIRDQVSIRLPKEVGAYGEIVSLFGSTLKDQGVGTYADILQHEYDAILPIAYWEWIEKAADVASILSRYKDQKAIKFVWPLLKDILQDCQCVVSGTSLEIAPYIPPLHHFGSFYKSTHRVFMSATVTDDSFLLKGLRLTAEVIKKPLAYEKERWSGEKMILVPSLIDASLDREKIVETFAKPSTPPRKFGIVALCPSFKGTRDWEKYGAAVADTNNIETEIGGLKGGNFAKTLVIVNRYDGIDLPDSSCRVLIMDSRPYSESVLDRYMERCLGTSESISAKTARKIEQGLGRSVRGEKDYCVIILTGPDLIKQIRTTASRRLFSTQTRTQIEIGIEIAEDAKADGDPL
jgi:replicative superfamily II helicase